MCVTFSIAVSFGSKFLKNVRTLSISSFIISGFFIKRLAILNHIFSTENFKYDDSKGESDAFLSKFKVGTYKAGETILIEVKFEQAVIVNGIPRLLLNNGSYATYLSGSGTSE